MIDISNRIESYINQQNSAVWNQLKNNYSFQLLLDKSETSWMVKIEAKSVQIITPQEEVNFASFTHELLHVYLDFLGLPDSKELLYGIKGDQTFEILTQDGLVGWIYNYSSHTKMFPYYSEMGFAAEEFVTGRLKFGISDLIIIRICRKIKPTRNFAINQFIGHSISMLNNVHPGDYQKAKKT